MRSMVLLAVLAIAGSAPTLAAEPDQSSPYDKNPKCAERTADSNAPECMVQTEGEPRQTYPPTTKPPKPPTPPPTPSSPPSSVPQAPRPGASR